MASVINTGALTLNPKEAQSISEFIQEQIFNQPALASVAKIMSGVTMNQQIVFAGRLAMSGIAGTGCARVSSSPTSVLTQKNVLPELVEDTLIHCQKDVNALLKSYWDKITSVREQFDIEGTDEAIWIQTMLTESAKESIQRLFWLGDKAVPVAAAGSAGVTAAGLQKYFSSLYGIWYRIFAGVTANTISRITISENAGATIAAQKAISSTYAIDLFEQLYATADERLKSAPNAEFLVSGWLFENYKNYLTAKGGVYNIDIVQNGLQNLKWNGFTVVNMASVWDLYGFANFVANTTDNTYYLPNRAIFTVPENLIGATLNEGEMANIEAFYEPISRSEYMAYAYTLDTQVLVHDLIEVAY